MFNHNKVFGDLYTHLSCKAQKYTTLHQSFVAVGNGGDQNPLVRKASTSEKQ